LIECRKYSFFLLLTTLGLIISVATSSSLTNKLESGVVVSSSPYASIVGTKVLERGGNAVDAAVATAFALAVTYPEAGNIGGGGFMLLHDSKTGKEYFVDFREKAPLRAHRDMYLDEEGNIVEGLSVKGIKAVGVPGTIAGLYLAHRAFGVMKWGELIEPAISLAEDGFVVGGYAERLRRLKGYLDEFPELRRFVNVNGHEISESDTLRQPELARTLRLIARDGPAAFYNGPIARMIIDEMKERGGLITLEDLRRYEAKFRSPVYGEYKGYRIVSAPPPSSGGTILIEILNILEGYKLSSYGPLSYRSIRLITEAERRAFYDRSRFLGDPDFISNPVAYLTSKSYADSLRRTIFPDRATPSSDLGDSDGELIEHRNTTHFSIIDCEGNAVAVTITLNSGFGSKVLVRNAGFLLNNEMDDFSIKPGVPNIYGLVGNEANAIEPEKRMLSSMCPTFVFKGDSLFLILGSPGGSRIITTVAQIIINVVDYGMSLSEAISTKRFHHQWLPDKIFYEGGAIDEGVKDKLCSYGYSLQAIDGSIGEVNAIEVSGTSVVGIADPRGIGKVVELDCN